MSDRTSRVDTTKAILTVPTIIKIVEIMLARFPVGSEMADEILKSYRDKGFISNEAMLAIVVAIEEEPGLSNLDFNDISDNEMGIIPYYIKKLKEGVVADIRQKTRVSGTEHQEQ